MKRFYDGKKAKRERERNERWKERGYQESARQSGSTKCAVSMYKVRVPKVHMDPNYRVNVEKYLDIA